MVLVPILEAVLGGRRKHNVRMRTPILVRATRGTPSWYRCPFRKHSATLRWATVGPRDTGTQTADDGTTCYACLQSIKINARDVTALNLNFLKFLCSRVELIKSMHNRSYA